MARKTKEDAEKTYLALLEAAAELFASQGVATTTLNEISKRAGVTRGAFYWHFNDKGDVIRALWQTYALPAFDPIREVVLNLPEKDPAAIFCQQVDRMLGTFIHDERVRRAMFIVLHNMEFSEKETGLIEYLTQEHERFEATMIAGFERIRAAGQLRQGVEPRLAALGFMCFFIGIINKYLLPFSELNLEQDGRPLINLYLQGILVESPNLSNQ